jgi:di/tricarboxylate transporter
MELEALLTLGTLVSFLFVALRGIIAVDIALVAVMTVLLLLGILTPTEAFGGFSNPALVVIACFYIVSAAVKETGALNWWVMKSLGKNKQASSIMPRIIFPTALISSVISNTPVVAIFIPQLQQWARRHNLSPSKIMMPLSFAAILGGTLSLIGTSTNIILLGLLEDADIEVPFKLFSPALIGIPLIIICTTYFILLGSRWLPNRKDVSDVAQNARSYAVSMRVSDNSGVAGKSIAEAGLRDLKYSYLAEIQSHGRIIPAVSPSEIVQERDILVFMGPPEAVSELREIPGLEPAETDVHKLRKTYGSRSLIEAVVAPTSNLVGKTVKQSNFRTTYGGAILAISRNGEEVIGKAGSITLMQGDTLLIESSPDFLKRHNYGRDFMLLANLDGTTLPDTAKAKTTLALLAAFVLVVFQDLLPISSASLGLACALVLTKCISLENAQKSIDLRLLAAIGSSLALGLAIQKTGLANAAADVIISLADGDVYLNLIFLYFATIMLTESITNNAAIVIAFPIAQELSLTMDASLSPFLMAIMFGASMSFLTPFGYQTNLMVQGPGRYKPADYLKVGIPLSILCSIVVIGLVPLIWPF